MFNDAALALMKQRYLWDKESPQDMFSRVANFIGNNTGEQSLFLDMMSKLYFLPNTPCLVNAGKEKGQLAACFVIPIEDSIAAIFEGAKMAAIIHQSGGGTGFNFSKLRCRGSSIKSSNGFSSGPVSFLKVYNEATKAINNGGQRRGANMGILNCDHPDIIDFIELKGKQEVSQFNLSIGITDEFMNACRIDSEIDLICPKNGIKGSIKANTILDAIVDNAHKIGCPGMLFLNRINEYYRGMVKMDTCNPCGEMPLEPWECCNLISVNVAKCVSNGKLDDKLFEEITIAATMFANNVIDKNSYPFKENKEIAMLNRKIGVGIMGFHEYLVKCGVKYSSNEAVAHAEYIAYSLIEAANKESRRKKKYLIERYAFNKKFYQKIKNIKKNIDFLYNVVFDDAEWKGDCGIKKADFDFLKRLPQRNNLTLTTIAPTGSIARLAMTTHSIEPVFSKKTVSSIAGMQFKESFDDSLFESAHEIPYEQHIKIQSAFQKHIDNAVSKTINMPNNATKQDIKNAFIIAHNMDCKGITVYRDGSHKEQPIKCDGDNCTL